MKNSNIEWTDHTFNPWIGCTKVSTGCANCYAEARDQRFAQGIHWGKGAPRQRTSPANWKQPLKWDHQITRQCRACGVRWSGGDGYCPSCKKNECDWIRARVFCASIADWLDDEVPIEWLADLLSLILSTPNLTWLLLSKRPQNFEVRITHAAMYMAGYRDGQSSENPTQPAMPGFEMAFEWARFDRDSRKTPANVWIGTTTENQEQADKRIPHLLQIPAKVRFLSVEPMLANVDLTEFLFHRIEGDKQPSFSAETIGEIHWVICGGESGPSARPMHPDWACSLRDQCRDAGVPFLFKQWGEWAPASAAQCTLSDIGKSETVHMLPDGSSTSSMMPPARVMVKAGKKAAGRLLDGCEWNEFPTI